MAIVKAERRQGAIELLSEIRIQMRGLLTQADALQATIEGLELQLGLTTEQEQTTRDQLIVLHCREGEETGHSLDECDDKCAAVESLDMLGESGPDTPEPEKV
jgi:hypothetical protein